MYHEDGDLEVDIDNKESVSDDFVRLTAFMTEQIYSSAEIHQVIATRRAPHKSKKQNKTKQVISNYGSGW
jgi:hypothetical protein